MNVRKGKLNVLIVLGCVLGAALNCDWVVAQEPETPIFRTDTKLIQLDVVVKSKDLPVTGLTKDDFQVFDNGKPQKISVFSVRDASVPSLSPKPLPAGVVTNRPESGGPEPVSATVILIDAQNTQPEDQGFARLQALKYLDSATRLESIAVYALDIQLKVLQDFTSNRAMLRTAIEHYKMTQSLHLQDDPVSGLLRGIKSNQANYARLDNLQRQVDITSAAFELIARHLEGLPGRKKLIWISAGLPQTVEQENERDLVSLTEFSNLSPPLYASLKVMNDANVAVYPVDARGGSVCIPPHLCLADPNIATMVTVARMTGGKAAYVSNDLAKSMEQAVTDTDLTYTLGYYSTEENIDQRLHSISIKVDRNGVETRYRKSYTAEDPAKRPTEKFLSSTMNAWVRQPLESTQIGLQAAAVPAVNRPGYYDVEVCVDVAGLKLENKNDRFVGSFDVVMVPDADNKPKGLHQTIQVNLTPGRLQTAMDKGILVVNHLRVTGNNGKLLSDKIHVVVMDNATGRTGSVRIPIGTKH